MKKVFLISTAVLCIALIPRAFSVMAAVTSSPGEEVFIKNCAVCHAGGGNSVNADKPLMRNALNANGIRTPADIVAKMRKPGPGMTQFDENAVPDRMAMAVAKYILKTFR
jgi:cytochrome c6